MKPSTEYEYRFENVGTPADTETGRSNTIGITKALFVWLQRVSMNKNLRITIERNVFEGMSGDGADELESFFKEQGL